MNKEHLNERLTEYIRGKAKERTIAAVKKIVELQKSDPDIEKIFNNLNVTPGYRTSDIKWQPEDMRDFFFTANVEDSSDPTFKLIEYMTDEFFDEEFNKWIERLENLQDEIEDL